MRKIKATGEGLSTDEDINIARFDGRIKAGKVAVFLVVAIKAGGFDIREELF